MFAWIYAAALTMLGLAYLPKLLYDMLRKKKYRQSLKQRLGIGWPQLPKGPAIWLHAVSVGETRAIAPLAALIAQQLPQYPLIVSSVTETGHAVACQLIPQAAAHLFLPFDLRWLVRRLLRKLSLHALIISENDLWPAFMAACKERGAYITLVNGKLSQRSLSRFQWCKPLQRQLTGLLDMCCVQNELYAARFHQLGVAPARLHVTGNLKFDRPPKTALTQPLYQQLGLDINALPQLIVVGSTHGDEEQMLLEALLPLLEATPDLRLILAPRHPERFAHVAALLEQITLPSAHWSQGCSHAWRLLLIDTMGLLPTLYPLAQVAIVGGSFIPGIGGHNIIEPCLVGTPVLFGPHMYSQQEMVTLVHTYQAGQQLATTAALATTLQMWLTSPSQLTALQAGCYALQNATQGTVAKTYLRLQSLLVKT